MPRAPTPSVQPEGAPVETALDLLRGGIGLFDAASRLIYCNKSFSKLRFLPERLCVPGTPLADIVRHIAARGDYGAGDTETLVSERLAEIVANPHWEAEQDIPGGRRLSIRHTPTPEGGLMITYEDVTEERATRAKLRDSEERYALVSQAAAEGIYDWNIADNSLYVSERVMEIFGFEGHLTSGDWYGRVHPDDAEGYRNALRECFRGKTEKVACEYRIKARDGSYRWVEDHGLPVRNARGRAVRLVGCVSDVGERRAMEQALRYSEQRYATALQAINESVYEWDIVSGEMYYSPRLHGALGLTSDQLRTREDWLNRIHPDDMPGFRAANVAHLKGETERLEVEYRYRHNDGTWHWARQHGVASRDANGRAHTMSGSTGDITAEKRLAEELDQARRRLHDALETIDEGFVLFDAEDRIVMCNSRYRSWFLDVADQVRPGNDFASFMRAAVYAGLFPAAEQDREAFLAAVLARRKNPKGPREQYLRSGIWLQISDYTMKDGSHVGVYTDITEQKHRQEEITKAKTDVEVALGEVQARTDDLSEALQQQTATADVLKVISRSAFDLKPVLETLVESAMRLCQADHSFIFLREDAVYRLAVSHGYSNEYAELIKQRAIAPGRNTLVARTVLERAVIHVHDVLEDPEYTWREAQQQGGFRTMLGVPLMRDGEPIGVISLVRNVVAPFTDKQIELVSTFADQAVIAIENVRLFDEVQARTEDLRESLQQQTATADVLKVISRSTFDLRSVLQTLVESAARLCEADKATITRQVDGVFYRAESFGFSDEFMAYVRGVPVEPSRETGTGRALLEGCVVHIADVEADPDYRFAEAQRLGDFRTMLAVPMLREGVAIGVIVLTRSEVRPFTDKQIELASTFADQAAIAIENVRLFESVEARTQELSKSLEELRTAQDRLVQTEKLASLGQLTAGIAHEIKNPLNFVNNFAALSGELLDELGEALGKTALDEELRGEIADVTDMLRGNLDRVVQHGKRADSIVKNMLLHSRQSSGEHRPSDVNAIVEESLNLAYHGARAGRQGFNITLEKALDPEAGEVDLFPQEITRVLLNLISNGFYAATKRRAQEASGTFEPTLSAATKSLGDRVEIRIRDNGTGIPPDVKAKMFNPFFTTKPAGEGTGLGLSLSHDIVVKQHAGTIEVETEVGSFTEFRIVLPRAGATMAKAGERQ
jgi:PAS domain S-box-containing protein